MELKIISLKYEDELIQPGFTSIWEKGINQVLGDSKEALCGKMEERKKNRNFPGGKKKRSWTLCNIFSFAREKSKLGC